MALFSLREVARRGVFFSRQWLVCQRCGEFFHGLGVLYEAVDLICDRRELRITIAGMLAMLMRQPVDAVD